MSLLSEIRSLFSTLMKWQGDALDPVDFVMACYTATFLLGAKEQGWGDLCGGAGTGKGELLRAVSKYYRTELLHNITENAFSSAYRDPNKPEDDKSLVWRLSEEREPKGPKVLVMPELTTFLAMRKEKVGKFFGDLRAAFDGDYDSQAGNIGHQSYSHLNFGMLTGCTEILDEFRKVDQKLGERTVVCRLARHLTSYEARRALAMNAAQTNRRRKETLRNEIQECTNLALNKAIERIENGSAEIIRSPAMTTRVGAASHLCVGIRTMPLSDRSYTRSPEAATRIPQQLSAIGEARIIFDERQVWAEDDYKLVRRICQDTCPPDNLVLFMALWDGGPGQAAEWKTLAELAKATRLDQRIIDRQCRQWVIIELLEFRDGTFRVREGTIQDVMLTNFFLGLEE